MFRILVVDHETSICEALAVGFSSPEYQVDVTSSGLQGIKLASMHKYDVVVIDPRLCDMGGIDAIRRLKILSPDAVSIVVTAQVSPESSAAMLHEGIAVCFEKPFEMRSIKSAVRDALRQREDKRGTQ
jgi:DNA-binding response OmpR family regulator